MRIENSQSISSRRRAGALTRKDVIAIIAVVFLLGIVILVPALGKARDKAQRASCQCRLKQIGLAFRTWDGDYSNKYTMSIPITNGGSMEWLAGSNMYRHFLTMSNEINNPIILTCPSDERKPAQDWGSLRNNNLSYFLGLDADETMPNLPLSGDRNLMTNGVAVGTGLVVIASNQPVTWSKQMHNLTGNIGLADGSVQQVNSKTLKSLLANTGLATNRLALP